jgi:hypothetical protein
VFSCSTHSLRWRSFNVRFPFPTQVVDANLPVYAKEVALAPAKAINGLRAVFGEVGHCSHFLHSAHQSSRERNWSSPKQWMHPHELSELSPHSAHVLFRWKSCTQLVTPDDHVCACGCA